MSMSYPTDWPCHGGWTQEDRAAPSGDWRRQPPPTGGGRRVPPMPPGFRGSAGQMGPHTSTRRTMSHPGGVRGSGGSRGGGPPTPGDSGYLSELSDDFDMAMRREQLRSGCPPGLRNLLIGLANIFVLIFIVIVLNKIYYEHDVAESEAPDEEVCFADDIVTK